MAEAADKVKLVAQQGPTVFLVDAGEGDFQGTKQHMVRLYDETTGKLGEPWPLQAFLARGYWEDVELSPAVQAGIEAEIAALL